MTKHVPTGLFELMSSIDPIIKPLIPMFLEQTLLRIQKLAESLEKSDFEAIKKVAHTMKGSSASYGFIEFADIARKIELIVQADDIDAADMSVQIRKLKDMHEAAESIVAGSPEMFMDSQE